MRSARDPTSPIDLEPIPDWLLLDRVVLTAARIGMCARLRALASSRTQKVETVLTADRLVLLAGVKSALLACERARHTPRCDHRRGVHHISTASSLGEGWRRLFARPPLLLCSVLQVSMLTCSCVCAAHESRAAFSALARMRNARGIDPQMMRTRAAAPAA